MLAYSLPEIAADEKFCWETSTGVAYFVIKLWHIIAGDSKWKKYG
ncbi:MAG: hypothetical protein GQF41_0102 [Candidatus Rifleibacterium amylolyticum]|nr:MAG: hypothetical protein GQF41_0102 [Candidatus Rifleibacterium amylolyticum]